MRPPTPLPFLLLLLLLLVLLLPSPPAARRQRRRVGGDRRAAAGRPPQGRVAGRAGGGRRRLLRRLLPSTPAASASRSSPRSVRATISDSGEAKRSRRKLRSLLDWIRMASSLTGLTLILSSRVASAAGQAASGLVMRMARAEMEQKFCTLLPLSSVCVCVYFPVFFYLEQNSILLPRFKFRIVKIMELWSQNWLCLNRSGFVGPSTKSDAIAQ